MICKRYNCLFVHVPKVAGQSIELFFLNLVGRTGKTRDEFLLKRNWNPARGPRRLSHLTAAEYTSCGYVPPAEYDSMFKFSFVRNPWDRLVSKYEYWRAHTECRRGIDFKTYLFQFFPEPGMGDKYRHVMPQYRFLFNSQGKLLVDFVGRFEKLHADFNMVCQRLNLAGSESKLPHKNQSRERKPYVNYFDEESKQHAAWLYRRDIELFNYTFGN